MLDHCVGVSKISVTASNGRTSIYLTNLLEMFNVLTEQEIAKVKPYIY